MDNFLFVCPKIWFLGIGLKYVSWLLSKCRLAQVLVQKRFGHTILRYLILHLPFFDELNIRIYAFLILWSSIP
jgi:hypothetical protein